MSENTKKSIQGRLLLKASDFVDVIDEETDAVVGSVPKHWGSEQLAAGTRKKGRGSSSSSASSAASPPAKREAGVEPPKAGAGSSTDEWVAYAKEKGASDADLLDGDGEPLKQAALIEKYGTPTS